MKKQILIILIVFLGAAAAAAAIIAWDLSRYADSPSNPEAEPPRHVTIPPGSGFKAATNILKDAGLVKNPVRFKILATLRKATTSIKAGEYRLSGEMTPEQIIDQLRRGRVFLHRVTIAEGLNLYQVADILEKAGLCSKDDFTDSATDPETARKFGIDANSLEGYLFPETYYFEKPVSPEKIIQTMTDRFKSVFNTQWEKRAGQLGFSVHEIVTLASIIEKETGSAQEREIIASVFHNRIKKNMRLDSDPTVIYGIENFDGNLTRKHLRTPTPYNTYTRKGLPPGPIANPGRASIKAALYPADTPYLYFVANSKNSHYFSTTLEEHNRAVRKYQLK
jgi:UPF0755 protein